MSTKHDPAAVDEYLAGLPQKDKAALEKLRKFIAAEVPDASQRVGYGGVVIFRLKSDLVGFAAYKDHLSFFVMNTALTEELKSEIGTDHKVTSATIHFTADNPLPDSLLKKIIKIRAQQAK